MILISEKLNSSIPSALKAFEAGNEALDALINLQSDAGYIDINTAMCSDEASAALNAANRVIDLTDCGIVIDSASPEITEKVISAVAHRRKSIINSVTASERLINIDFAAKYGTGIIIMPVDENGVPDTAEKRLENANSVIVKCLEKGLSYDDIYVDCIVESCAAIPEAAKTALETIALIKKAFPQVHITCGLSNLSFGLPDRAHLNAEFLAAGSVLGLDAPICDSASPLIRRAAAAANIFNGTDEYCCEYLEEVRKLM